MTRTTIAAIATPPGRGGIGIVRISGDQTPHIARTLLGRLPPPRYAQFATFRDADGAPLDQGLALYFPAPHSFTGEHVLELHGHGGPVVMDLLLQRVLTLGARLARPGEFSERAFLNGKLDLAQAEAVADLIDSASTDAARAALRSLEGEFSRRVHALVEALIRLRMHIEAAIDFPEEEIDFLADNVLQESFEKIQTQLAELRSAAQQGSLLHDGMTVVLAGRPNAGKSSLLNALAQRASAIVSATPGTTRDIVREQIVLDGMPLHVLDTAGLRTSQDDIENEGVQRARDAMLRADRVLLLVDDNEETAAGIVALLSELPADLRLTLVRNKVDLSQRPSGSAARGETGLPEVAISALSGVGLDELRTHLKECMGYAMAGQGTFSARRRHLDALQQAQEHIQHGAQHLKARQGELAAEELHQAQQSLSEITGAFTSDDLLGRIFSSFCIGK